MSAPSLDLYARRARAPFLKIGEVSALDVPTQLGRDPLTAWHADALALVERATDRIVVLIGRSHAKEAPHGR